MQLKRLKLSHFKNYLSGDFEFHPRLNLILGNNGMGKTNLLDAIYYIAFGKSYYAVPDRKLIRFDSSDMDDPFFRLEGYSNKSDQYVMTYSATRHKQVYRNDVEYDRISDHIGEIPLVSIFPEDIYLIRHGSALRRKFVDGTVGQLNREYLESLLAYNRILRQKNELLKNRRISMRDKHILLDKYDWEMISPGKVIESGRRAFVEKFNPLFAEYYDKIAQRKEELAKVVYACSFDSDDIGQELKESRDNDIEKGRSTKGPHKDDFRLLLNDQQAKYFASQGQQKSILFSLKLAQYAYIQSALKRNPLMLLDDFFEKLDHRRVDHVMSILTSNHVGQIFITDTDADRMIRMAEKAGLDYRAIYVESSDTNFKYI